MTRRLIPVMVWTFVPLLDEPHQHTTLVRVIFPIIWPILFGTSWWFASRDVQRWLCLSRHEWRVASILERFVSSRLVSACTDTFVQQPGKDRIAGVIYNIWQRTYGVMSRALLPQIEKEFHGQTPEGVVTTTLPNAQDENDGCHYPCDRMEFTYTSPQKEPMYTMNQVSHRSGIGVLKL